MSKSTLLQQMVVLFRKRYGRPPTTAQLDEMDATADVMAEHAFGCAEAVEIMEDGHIMVTESDPRVMAFAE